MITSRLVFSPYIFHIFLSLRSIPFPGCYKAETDTKGLMWWVSHPFTCQQVDQQPIPTTKIYKGLLLLDLMLFSFLFPQHL